MIITKNGIIWNDTNGNAIQAHGGGILYHDGVYYWYGESYAKINSDKQFNNGVMCYSSTDLVNWKNEGMVLSAITSRDWCEHDLYYTNIIQRPKVVYNRTVKKFMMYFHSDNPTYTRSAVGFAMSDSPTGKFHYLGAIRPHHRSSHDMTVFVDDDGLMYLFNASDHNSLVRAIKISDDGLHFGTYTVITMEEPCRASREAPAVFKRDGKYYMISSGCSGWRPNKAECHIADSILGEWKSLGDLCEGDGSELTFYSQSTFVLKVGDKYVYMGDRWRPDALDSSGYVWLPIEFENERPIIKWQEEWKGV